MSRRRRQRAGWKYLNNDHSSAATVTSARDRRLNLCQLSVLRRPCAGEHPQMSVFRHSLFSEKICLVTYVSSAKIWIVASLLFKKKCFCPIFELPIIRSLQQCVFEQNGTDAIIALVIEDTQAFGKRWQSINKMTILVRQDAFSVEMYKHRNIRQNVFSVTNLTIRNLLPRKKSCTAVTIFFVFLLL